MGGSDVSLSTKYIAAKIRMQKYVRSLRFSWYYGQIDCLLSVRRGRISDIENVIRILQQAKNLQCPLPSSTSSESISTAIFLYSVSQFIYFTMPPFIMIGTMCFVLPLLDVSAGAMAPRAHEDQPVAHPTCTGTISSDDPHRVVSPRTRTISPSPNNTLKKIPPPRKAASKWTEERRKRFAPQSAASAPDWRRREERQSVQPAPGANNAALPQPASVPPSSWISLRGPQESHSRRVATRVGRGLKRIPSRVYAIASGIGSGIRELGAEAGQLMCGLADGARSSSQEEGDVSTASDDRVFFAPHGGLNTVSESDGLMSNRLMAEVDSHNPAEPNTHARLGPIQDPLRDDLDVEALLQTAREETSTVAARCEALLRIKPFLQHHSNHVHDIVDVVRPILALIPGPAGPVSPSEPGIVLPLPSDDPREQSTAPRGSHEDHEDRRTSLSDRATTQRAAEEPTTFRQFYTLPNFHDQDERRDTTLQRAAGAEEAHAQLVRTALMVLEPSLQWNPDQENQINVEVLNRFLFLLTEDYVRQEGGDYGTYSNGPDTDPYGALTLLEHAIAREVAMVKEAGWSSGQNLGRTGSSFSTIHSSHPHDEGRFAIPRIEQLHHSSMQ